MYHKQHRSGKFAESILKRGSRRARLSFSDTATSVYMPATFYAVPSRMTFRFCVRQGSKMVINMQSAKALGLAVPQPILIASDELIE